MSQRRLQPSEVEFLEEAMNSDSKTTNLRLREGEYQFDLVKAIASFQLELHFPDVKDIIRRLYGEEKTNDLQFTRKIQTILKKMEKSSVIRILPKKKPWELQAYALLSFKFVDSDKNLVVLATDQEMNQARNLLRTRLSQLEETRISYAKLCTLVFFTLASYVAAVWSLMQPVRPIVFIPALSVSALCSLMVGKTLARG